MYVSPSPTLCCHCMGFTESPTTYTGTFDLLVYTDAEAAVPRTWEESDPKYIQNSTEVRLRSFTTRVRPCLVVLARRHSQAHPQNCRFTRWTRWWHTRLMMMTMTSKLQRACMVPHCATIHGRGKGGACVAVVAMHTRSLLFSRTKNKRNQSALLTHGPRPSASPSTETWQQRKQRRCDVGVMKSYMGRLHHDGSRCLFGQLKPQIDCNVTPPITYNVCNCDFS